MKIAKGKDAPTPPPLQLAWYCGQNHLPEMGGILDQDYSTMMQMTALSNIYNAVKGARGATGDAIHKLPSGTLSILASLREMGIGIGL